MTERSQKMSIKISKMEKLQASKDPFDQMAFVEVEDYVSRLDLTESDERLEKPTIELLESMGIEEQGIAEYLYPEVVAV